MRVPSIGLTLAERREIRDIVAEGYRWAEDMLADYRDPTLMETFGLWLAEMRGKLFTRS